jgi:hypothetical protein
LQCPVGPARTTEESYPRKKRTTEERNRRHPLVRSDPPISIRQLASALTTGPHATASLPPTTPILSGDWRSWPWGSRVPSCAHSNAARSGREGGVGTARRETPHWHGRGGRRRSRTMKQRSGSGEQAAVRKGPWTAEEDEVLLRHVREHGPREWSSIRSKGLLPRTGKSCRLRWVNKLRPDLKTYARNARVPLLPMLWFMLFPENLVRGLALFRCCIRV